MTRLAWLVLLASLAPLPALDIADAIRVPEDNTSASVADARVFYATWDEGISYNAGDVTVVSDDSVHSVTGTLFVLNGPLDSSDDPTSGTLIVALDETLNDGEAYHLEWPADLVTADSGGLLVSNDHAWNILVSGTGSGDGGPVPSVLDTPEASPSSSASIDHGVMLFYDPDIADPDTGNADPDADQRTAGMVLTIETLPGLGSLTLSGTPVVAGQDVDVDDIADGNLVYATSETSAGVDHFAFSWTDADGSTSPALWFEISLSGGGSDAPALDTSDFDVPFGESDLPLYAAGVVDGYISWVDLYFGGVTVSHTGNMGEVTVTVSYDDDDRSFATYDQLQYTAGSGEVTVDAILDGVDGADLKLTLETGQPDGDLENLLEAIEYRHTSALFTADDTRTLTVTIDEGGGSGGTVTSTHTIIITANAASPVLDEIQDGTQSYTTSPFDFIIDETGLELTVIAYDYEQQSVTVGLDPLGSIPINGTFDVVSTSSTSLASSADIAGPHSRNEIVIRYDPTNTEASDTLGLELTDGDASSTFSIGIDIDPYNSSRPRITGDPPLVTTASGGVHTYQLDMINLAGIAEGNCRFQGSPPDGIIADIQSGAGYIEFTWTASGDRETPVSFDYVLVDVGQAATVPVTTVAIDPDVAVKPTAIPPINN